MVLTYVIELKDRLDCCEYNVCTTSFILPLLLYCVTVLRAGHDKDQVPLTCFCQERIVPLDVKGCVCHFEKWQVHPFISKETI